MEHADVNKLYECIAKIIAKRENVQITYTLTKKEAA